MVVRQYESCTLNYTLTRLHISSANLTLSVRFLDFIVMFGMILLFFFLYLCSIYYAWYDVETKPILLMKDHLDETCMG